MNKYIGTIKKYFGLSTDFGVLKEQSNKYEYYKALYEYFNFVSHSYILAEVFRNK